MANSCAQLTTVVLDAPSTSRDPADESPPAHLSVACDADVVAARQTVRAIAARAGFSSVELTVIATAVSEIARNIVCFARGGEMVMCFRQESARTGITVVARDAGPGISDLAAALRDGVSTGSGLGLGLPGARRLMDEFEIVTSPTGTTVSMTKWLAGVRRS